MNRIIEKIKTKQFFLIAFSELIIGAILLVDEIQDFIKLPTTTEADEMFGGVVDLFKYQENTYCLLYLWTVILFAGISHWINEKLYWIFNKVLLMTMLFAIVWRAEMVFSFYHNWFFVIMPFLVVILSIWVEVRTCRKSYVGMIGIRRREILLSVFLGILSMTIYFFIDEMLVL